MLTATPIWARFMRHAQRHGPRNRAQSSRRQETTLTARHEAISDIAAHRVAKTQDYLEQAGADIYGQYVFHEEAQRQYLAKPIFKKLRRTIEGQEPFDRAIGGRVAHGAGECDVADSENQCSQRGTELRVTAMG